jgi:hypothetical protein
MGLFSPPGSAEEAGGQAIGSALGSALPIPGGSFIGSFLGGKIGSLFGGDKDYPWFIARVGISNQLGYSRVIKTETLDGASAAEARQLGDYVAKTADEFFNYLGVSKTFEYKPGTSGNFEIGYSAARDNLSQGFFSMGGSFADGAKYEGLSSAEDAVNYTLTEILNSVNLPTRPDVDAFLKKGLAEGKTAKDLIPQVYSGMTQSTPEANTATTQKTDAVYTQSQDDPYSRLMLASGNNLTLIAAVLFGIFLITKGK